MKRSHLAREIVETVALTILIFIVIRFAIQSYHVEGPSMQPGLNSNEYVVVNKVAYVLHGPERGDVIVFHYPLDTTQDFIKRVVGLPGDTVHTDSAHIWVNGVQLSEPYISTASNPVAKTWQVPSDQYFVLGDNRPDSTDSRYWGFVPKNFIVGKAVIIYWPITNWQFVNTYSAVYTHIKPGQ